MEAEFTKKVNGVGGEGNKCVRQVPNERWAVRAGKRLVACWNLALRARWEGGWSAVVVVAVVGLLALGC
jgi:hypothetical protein